MLGWWVWLACAPDVRISNFAVMSPVAGAPKASGPWVEGKDCAFYVWGVPLHHIHADTALSNALEVVGPPYDALSYGHIDLRVQSYFLFRRYCYVVEGNAVTLAAGAPAP